MPWDKMGQQFFDVGWDGNGTTICVVGWEWDGKTFFVVGWDGNGTSKSCPMPSLSFTDAFKSISSIF